MRYDDQLAMIVNLPFDKEQRIHSDGEIEIYVFRPSKLSNRFKDYDVNKNFQVWLKQSERKFRPNHLRVMIDLDLRVRSRPDLQKNLAAAFDDIYYGAAPESAIASLKNENFKYYLNSLEITAYLSQLFLIEQDYAYRRESKYNPRTLFYQGWIRQVINSGKEIDNLIMSIASGRPPDVKYTYQEDLNHKKNIRTRQPLWWLNS